MNFTTIASRAVVKQTTEALEKNNINVVVATSKEEAKKIVSNLIPANAEVMTATSVTLDQTGIAEYINSSEKYTSVMNTLSKMDRKTQSAEMQRLGAAPEWIIGSVHAITEDGTIVVASNTGSQLPGYTYGASHVVFVVGTQKIVKNVDEAMKRIYDYVLPLESERAKKAYGVPGSFVSKLYLLHKEINPARTTVIFVEEALGY